MSAEVMTTEEVAAYLSRPVGWVEKARAARQIPITKVGREYRFLKVAIDAWLAEHTEWPGGALAPVRSINSHPPTGPTHPMPGPSVPGPPSGPRPPQPGPRPSKKRCAS